MTDPDRYDSAADTLRHAVRVAQLIAPIIGELVTRAATHDASKLEPPEKEIFDQVSPLLAGTTYGSDEYRAQLAAMGPALAHHYAHNRHHPEFHPGGVEGMTLIDLLETLADWKAASERHADGDLGRSLDVNTDRFGLSAQLAAILANTARHLGWLPADDGRTSVTDGGACWTAIVAPVGSISDDGRIIDPECAVTVRPGAPLLGVDERPIGLVVDASIADGYLVTHGVMHAGQLVPADTPAIDAGCQAVLDRFEYGSEDDGWTTRFVQLEIAAMRIGSTPAWSDPRIGFDARKER